MSTQLNKIEAVLQATVETLQEAGLGGFEVQLHFFDHYESKVWQRLAVEANAKNYRLSVARKEDQSDSLSYSVGYSGNGQWTITMYLPHGFINRENVDQNHKTKLQEIIND